LTLSASSDGNVSFLYSFYPVKCHYFRGMFLYMYMNVKVNKGSSVENMCSSEKWECARKVPMTCRCCIGYDLGRTRSKQTLGINYYT